MVNYLQSKKEEKMMNNVKLRLPEKNYGVVQPAKEKPTLVWYLLIGVFLASTAFSVFMSASTVDNLTEEKIIGFVLLSALTSFIWLLYYTPMIVKRNEKNFVEAVTKKRNEYIDNVLIPWLRTEHGIKVDTKKAMKLYQGKIVSVDAEDVSYGVKLNNITDFVSYVEGAGVEPMDEVEVARV